MQKIFLMLFATMFAFYSCSSEDDVLSGGNKSEESTQTVTFQVRNSGFATDDATSSKLSKTRTVGYSLLLIAYKAESGEYFAKKQISNTSITDGLLNVLGAAIDWKLPKGNYTIAMIAQADQLAANGTEVLTNFDKEITPKNFNTDYFTPVRNGKPETNDQIFYETASISVTDSDFSVSGPVDLKPMWSDVVITFEDADLENYPFEEYYSDNGKLVGVMTDATRITYDQGYYGFELKSKLAKKQIDFLGSDKKGTYVMRGWEFENQVSLKISKGSDTNMSFKATLFDEYATGWVANFYTTKNFSLDSKYQFENGNTYSISGLLFTDNNLTVSVGKLNYK